MSPVYAVLSARTLHTFWDEMQFDLTGAIEQIQKMGNAFLQRLPYLAMALLVFAAFYLAAKLLRGATRRIFERRTRHRNVGFVVGRLAQGTLVILGLLVALVIALPTFRPGQLVQLLGISSVAIGFAFRDILQNFLAGILLLLTEPFKIGDQIRFGEYEGIVEDVQTRATMIRTYDSRRMRVRWWIEPPRRSDALDTQDKVLLAIKKTLSANGIDLPFETRVLLFHDQTEEADGDRRRQREGWPAGDGGNGEVPRPRGIAASLRELAQARSSQEGGTQGSNSS